MNSLIEIGLYLSYVLLIITLLSIIIIPIYFTIVNFKKAKQGLIGVGLLAVVLLIAYLISPADQGLFYETMKVGPTGSKVIGAGLFTTYFAFIAIVVVILFAEVGKLFK
jgi:NADH:ubiquinone oxidoreductase subunit 6 (subunit J)